MIKCIIVDDEPLAIELLSDYVKNHESLECIATFSNPIEAMHFIESNDVDLIFLDVQMPELSGIQFMKINNKRHQVILTTAYAEYAIEGFDHDVVDYLLKPISSERFDQAIQKFQNSHHHEPITSGAGEIIFVKSEYKTVRIDLSDILYVEGLADYIAIKTSKDRILTLDTMKNFASILPSDRFIRVHKSFIVAIKHIEFIERNEIHMDGKIIPIGETYKSEFWERIKK